MRKAPFSKNFSSLDRRRVGRAVRPVDSLVSSGMENLERKRDDNKPTKNGTQSDTHKILDHPLKQHDLKLTNQYERKINPEEYAIKIRIKAVYHDGKSLKDDEALLFRVSSDNSKVFVTHNGNIVDSTVFSRHGIKAITFGSSHKSILIEIHESSYIFIKHLNNDTFLHDYFNGTALWKFRGRIADENLIDTMTQLDSQRKRINGTNEKATPEPEKVSKDPTISPVAPLSAYSIPLRRSTRERRPPSGNKLYVLEPIEETETPARFSPPLSYKFHDNKVFTVTQNDFKTLYNNDWINDTVIDFFIKYDIDKAVHKHNKFAANDIYAFNSFFFTKLISGEEYYANVKRWLNKIDLMLFPYIIIPINENLHWYGCIIRGLPELLERKKNEIDLTNHVDEAETTETIETQTIETETSPNNSQDILEVPNPQGRKRAEVFIFDSLSQRHNNIHIPLKLFIIDYCMDKHNIAIRKDEIRIQHARVPRQNNFNDCGIHVIYNIRKWLGHSTEIEKVWRNYQRAAYRSYFVAEERNKMRRELIDLLLKLHEEQVHVEQGTHESEDEIEVIEELLRSASQELATKQESEPEKETKIDQNEPLEKTKTAQSEPLEKTKTNQESEPKSKSGPAKPSSSLNSTKEKAISDIMISFGQKSENSNATRPKSTTLDPRQIKNPFINHQIREIFAGLLIAPLIYEMINKLFPDAQERVSSQDLAKLQRLATSISSLDRQSEKSTKDALSHWKTQLSQKLEQRRPKDESFVIRDENDDKLNQSVHDLSIKGSSDDLLSEVLFQADSSTPSKTYGEKGRNATKRRRLNS